MVRLLYPRCEECKQLQRQIRDAANPEADFDAWMAFLKHLDSAHDLEEEQFRAWMKDAGIRPMQVQNQLALWPEVRGSARRRRASRSSAFTADGGSTHASARA